MNPISFSNPALAQLNQVALNPQPLPPIASNPSNSLWGYLGSQTATGQANSADDPGQCGTPWHKPGPPLPHGPALDLGAIQASLQLQA